MGPASYIGRVGGLAVALGVGTAIAMGHGVSAAETSDSSSTSSDSPTGNTSTTDSSTDNSSATPKAPESGARGAMSGPAPEIKDPDAKDDDTKDDDAKDPDAKDEDAKDPDATDEDAIDPDAKDEEEPDTKPEESGQEPVAEEDTVDEVEPEAQPSEEGGAKEGPAAEKIDAKDSGNDPAARTPSQPGTITITVTGQSTTDPGSAKQEEVVGGATFVDARVLAASGPLNISPMMAAQTTEDITVAPETDPDLLTEVVDVISNVVDSLLNPLAGDVPIDPAAPLAWSLLAFARKELDDLVNGLTGATEEDMGLADVQTMSLALAAPTPPPTVRPGFPAPGQYVSVSTQFVDWITGNNPANNTQYYYGVTGTDLGIMWDNGMVDDPNTPINEHQVLIAFGDTFGLGGMAAGTHWRSNVLFRSVDADLFNGMDFTDPEWFTGSDFGGSPLTYVPSGAPYQYMARQIIFPEGLPAGITLIPTAGISVPTPGTEYGVTQYISFMSVTQWGAPGVWTTNYSAIAYSTDNGEVWHVAPQTVRYNTAASGNQNFQQMAFVRPGDGFVYAYGTPNGRQGAAYVARVLERDILDLSKYEYYSAGSAGGWYGVGATPAGWVKGKPAAATPLFGQSTTTPGACGAVNVNPGSAVSEMSVQYNQQLKKYVALHGDRNNNIVMRTSDRPEGGWSGPQVLMTQQNGGIYAPMMHPWSPSTQGTGTDLYWNLSMWSDYNVMLMKTDLSKVK
ncbi:DUF4185 domain-containing protein [Mycolicibacterium tusciae]|uniref:DUF4185 domain-containing protein n=1 Tax=Mycolicibacterium tusciae TaxID=75922 RepID=UPI00024A46B9|nr:DUF4185 domain-containing protein [Mycolicibacterium tusciae]